MTATEQSLEERLQELMQRVQHLEHSLDQITLRLESPATAESSVRQAPPAVPAQLDEPADVSEEMLSWAGRNALLPRMSTVCFLLVVALILRTITDSGLINSLAGSALGMSYAAILMIVGWQKYRHSSPLAPVFAACGAVLMSTIVVETHTHFQSLPLIPAYLTLMATGVGMALLSRQFGALAPISFGTLGICLAGAAIDYPHPYFPYLALVLWTANLLGFVAGGIKRCSWLRWIVMLVSMVMLQLWAFRLGGTYRKGLAIPPDLAEVYFMPVLWVFAASYLLLALVGILRSGQQAPGRFEQSLPAINVLWAFSCALYVVFSRGTSLVGLGVFGVAVAVGHLVLAFWMARREPHRAAGAAAFTLASGALLALALPAATGKLVLTLPIISVTAIFMAIVSREWGSGSVRAVTYLLHLYCCAALAVAMRATAPEQTDAVFILPAMLLSCIMIYQYLWCRWWPPLPESSMFFQLDREDRSAVLLLLAGLVCGFLALRTAIFQVVQITASSAQVDIFRCSQSVLINVAAMVLMLWACWRRDREIRNVAILVTLFGAAKVFLHDLLGSHGLPLVCSVFSFGLAAAVESIALGKWPKAEPSQVEQATAPAVRAETAEQQ